jgi:transcriptional regulator with XRE-family HTH domain
MTKATQVIARRIKELRIGNGLSQAALADSAGVDRKTINRIERNHFSPSLDTFFRICVALNVEPNTIIKGVKV